MNLETLYNEALAHKQQHKSCGGEPYKEYLKLDKIVKDENIRLGKPLKILEIGTAVGFTAYILQNKVNLVDTIEWDAEHLKLASENIQKWGGLVGKMIFLLGDAMLELPTLKNDDYDIIFFDGFGVKQEFYPHFLRCLKLGALLIVANSHLKSTEQAFFEEINRGARFKLLDEFTDTKVYKKI
jgi:predicted O-methyltransferase YrrM